MRKLSILLLMAAVMISCEKDDSNSENDGPDLPDDSGKVTVKVVDDAGNPVEDAAVEIASGATNQILYSDSTGEAGKADAGILLKGEYRCGVAAKIGRPVYEMDRYFQVIPGKEKSIEVNPVENSGKITLKVVIIDDNSPAEGINLALIPHFHAYDQEYTFEGLTDEAYFIKTADENGKLTMDQVPVTPGVDFEGYSVFAYYSKDTAQYSHYNIRLDKGEHLQQRIKVDLW